MNSSRDENCWDPLIDTPLQAKERISPHLPGLLDAPFTARQGTQSLRDLVVVSDATHVSLMAQTVHRDNLPPNYCAIALRNSLFVLNLARPVRSFCNASTGGAPLKARRRRVIASRSFGASSNSSRRVPEALMSTAGQ